MRKMYSKKQIEGMAKSVADNEFDSKLPTATIESSQISTGEETDGKVMMANGEGGVKFGDVGGGSAIAYEGVSILPTNIKFTDWTLHRAIKIDSVLWVVVCGTITNNGTSQGSFTDMCEITLPSTISSKIYRADGTSCDQAPTSQVDTNTLILLDMGGAGTSERLARAESKSANKIRVKWAFNTSINAGASIQFNVRFPLFLDIGSVE